MAQTIEMYTDTATSGTSASADAERRKKQQQLISQYGNEAKTYYFLRNLKWTHKGTCAVMGNINQESGFRTTAVSFDGYGSLGICQWTFGRRANLEKFLQEHGYSIDSLEGQVKFLDYETKTNYPTIYAYLTKASEYTLEETTKKFCKEWERPAEEYANYPRRIASAQTYNDRYANTYSSGDSVGAEFVGAIDFNKTVEQLISSNNFEYIQQEEETKQSFTAADSFTQVYKSLQERSITKSVGTIIRNVVEDIALAGAHAAIKAYQPKQFESLSEWSGSSLPIYTTVVEAPFGEITLGEVTFGTVNVYKKYTSYPNYVQSITINKTNGTVNDYTIVLVHQIAPGDNPNYIAELLSITGYNTIKISYGDAASGKYFQDIEALLIDVQTNFDIGGSRITYTLKATSLSYLTATSKLSFPATTDKPSNVIRNLLKDKSDLISDYFNGMYNLTYVESSGLIPKNDKVVSIAEVINKTLIEYLAYLTALMQDENPELENKSSYYLTVNDELQGEIGNTFSIKEIVADDMHINSFMYEVDIGYPDKNMVFDFNINTNYAWAAAYETANKISNYNYDIDNNGQLNSQSQIPIISATNSTADFLIDSNTWKQLTRFPISATLTTKQLVAPIMLLNYIKINNYYFGSKRITSGLYIVTGQTDIISGNGCRTTLNLTRVASEEETLTVDGRVRT